MRTITESEAFYGYIIGLHVGAEPDSRGRYHLYATFAYGSKVTVWEVPDEELFSLLASHLCEMARDRVTSDDYGYSKLWISKANGRWHAELP